MLLLVDGLPGDGPPSLAVRVRCVDAPLSTGPGRVALRHNCSPTAMIAAITSSALPLDSPLACAALLVAGSLGLLLFRQPPGKKPVAEEPELVAKQQSSGASTASAVTDEVGRAPEQPPALVSPPTTPEEAGREEPEEVKHEQSKAPAASKAGGEFAAGTRVQIHSLQKAASLNGSYGVVLRCEAGRFALRKELTLAGDSANVSVKASNLRVAPAHDLASVQALVDAAPNGARITLPRGMIAAGGADDEAAEDGAPPPTLELKTAITLTGMGSRTGGTVLGFSVCLGPEVEGEEVELSNFHINGGTLDISPMDLQRLRLTRVSVTAPAGTTKPAVLLDEIGLCSPGETAALEGMCSKAPRVLLEECWTRGGSVGVMVNVMGCTLRGCRLQGARTFGVHANATFAIEGCTIGQCRTGGISARKEVEQLRVNGCNENRVQRDPNDTQYMGYDKNAHGCVGTCTCAAITMFAGYGDPLVKWDDKGGGQWRKLGM